MKIVLLTLRGGFIEELGESKDFTLDIKWFNMTCWAEDREVEDNLKKDVNIMTLAEFEKLTQLPLEVTPSGQPVMDRQKNVTEDMIKLFTVGAAHTECSHVMFMKKW